MSPPPELSQPKKDRDPLLTRPRQEAFLAAYGQCAVITIAAKHAKISRRTHYDWMKNDPEYAERFRHAHEEAIDLLEAEALRRATRGVERPIMFGGKQVQLQDPKHPDDESKQIPGVMKEYSDVLLIFLLKGARPEKYRDRFEVTGKVKHDMTIHETRESIQRISVDEQGLRALELIAQRQMEAQAAETTPQTTTPPLALIEATPQASDETDDTGSTPVDTSPEASNRNQQT